jgi:hypothetical protein
MKVKGEAASQFRVQRSELTVSGLWFVVSGFRINLRNLPNLRNLRNLWMSLDPDRPGLSTDDAD